MRVLIFGAQAGRIRGEFDRYAELESVLEEPDVVVCYGGDGTLLSAEHRWPTIPKVPIRNSRRGNRCIARPAAQVIERLAEGTLIPTKYLKLECALHREGSDEPAHRLTAMNEFNCHMARINSAVRFRMWIDEEPYAEGREILGDGFVISTPFGSTAYFNHITRGSFHAGIGIAFKSTSEHTNHIIVDEDDAIRIRITRGPATLAYDNCADYVDVNKGDTLLVRKHAQAATVLTWSPMKYPSDAF